jgi:adenylate kinase
VRLVVFGPQGAGKGTQSQLLAEKYDIPAIVMGDMFRWAIGHDTEVGLKAAEYVRTGRFVPDEITIEVVRERLAAADCAGGFLLDGFPRNRVQAKALDAILAEQGSTLDAAVAIEVPEEVSLRRIMGRLVCSNCGRNYHLDAPPADDSVCDRCGGEVRPRADDKDEEAIRERLRLYHEQTEPLKEYYEARGVLLVVDGQGTRDEVLEEIVTQL